MCDDYRAAYHIDQHMRLLTVIPQLKYHLPLYGAGMGLWQKRLIWTLFGKQREALFRDRNARGAFFC